MSKFWMVLRDKGGNQPSVKHATEDAAKAEAERLARKEGASYYILEAVGAVEPLPSPILYTDLRS